MFKHYYVSPKKRSKSQSSEISELTESPSSHEHQDCLSEFVKSISRKTFSSFNEITSSNPNVSIATSPSHGSGGGGGCSGNDELYPSETSTPTQTPQKTYETRLSRVRLAHAFSNAVSYSRTRLAHLPAGASFCVGHVYGSVSHTGNAETCQTNNQTSGLTPPVRRWNSFHSTRGECHPNKFRRDRKSTSPSIV